MVTDFTAGDVPDQTGRTVFVTGANAGLGFETAKVLAARGARVLMGCRSRPKAEAACSAIRMATPEAELAVVEIDMADLASVRAAAETVRAEPRLDVLINNAGLMMPPYGVTKDGFEQQFGVNHLAGFALTGLLLETLTATPSGRVVITASNAHKRGRILFDDLQAQAGYDRLERYAMSKLANLLHMAELDRRLRTAATATIATACHPGAAATELMRNLPGPVRWMMPLVGRVMNTAAEGAWPTLAAATAPDAAGGEYFGPARMGGWAGPARVETPTGKARDMDAARRLWRVSEELTGVRYPV